MDVFVEAVEGLASTADGLPTYQEQEACNLIKIRICPYNSSPTRVTVRTQGFVRTQVGPRLARQKVRRHMTNLIALD
jgi:hypothetical protein